MTSLKETPLIAPCGINCSICRAYLRERNPCPGCRGNNTVKPKTRVNCKIKTCTIFTDEEKTFCYQCKDFPCQILEKLDDRYRKRYHMSVLENLEEIRDSGIEKFLENEKIRWTCTQCKGIICVHDGRCSQCGEPK